jgi:threonine synthase
MTTTIDRPAETLADPGTHSPADQRVTGMVCRACAAEQPLGLRYVCPDCFGPLEVRYDLKLIAASVERATIEASGATWNSCLSTAFPDVRLPSVPRR